MKQVSTTDYLAEAQRCREITQHYGAKLIINDQLEVALGAQADGVHLGQDDLCTAEARRLAPPGFIIGGTANTLAQVRRHIANGVDYVGLGPLRFTTTKEKLSPLLGVEGYAQISQALKQEGLDIPLIAIGGIQLADIAPLLQAGVYGIAVSSLLTHPPDKQHLVSKIITTLNL
jgi:thiamine-phosphate pyrophosphorylase